MKSQLELLEQIHSLLTMGNHIVDCPSVPAEIPGITAGDAFDANDVFGTILKIKVPKSGVIYSATFWDFDYEGTQINLHIFKEDITQIASDAAWAPSDEDMQKLVTRLAFVAFDGHTNSYTSELTNIGKGYNTPDGYFYIQAQCVGTPTIAAGKSPKVQLQIMPMPIDW